jgi:hypothetical protein
MNPPVAPLERDEYVDFLLRQYRLVDAYWFLTVERLHGLEAAVRANEEVWDELGGKTAREIKRRFKVGEKGLRGFVRALGYFPWTTIGGYEISEEEGKVALRVPACPPQVARKKLGLGEFPCKRMHALDFEAFAREIDGRIRVRCVYAPPDPHPDGNFCEWEFTIA